MSALLQGWTPRPSDPGRRPQRLRPVARSSQRMARVPFLLVLAATLGLGMAGLLVLNTTVQTTAVEVRTLERQAVALSYTEAELATALDQAESPADLAEKASDLGLRPNPYPAFIDLETGEVSGDPRPVTGDELTSLVTKSDGQLAKEKAAADKKAAERKAAAEKKAAEKKAAEKKAAEKKAAEKKAAEKKAAEKKEKAAAEKKAADQKKDEDKKAEKKEESDDE